MMHPEVLPPIQQACLRQLGPAAEMLGFYMVGQRWRRGRLGMRASHNRWLGSGSRQLIGATSAA